jgi:hypothetical protein
LKTPEDEAFEQIERIQRTRTKWVPVEKPQRQWVGLTDEEFNELYDSYVPTACYALLIEKVEAKLREKNNA